MLTLYLDNLKVDMAQDFKVNMTYQQTDLQKPEAKLNSYSKTVNVPGTNNNNNIFGHIFRFDSNIISTESLVGASFDPNKRIPFVLLNNGDLYNRGYAQLDKIVIKKGIITYQLTLYGNMGTFFYNLMYKEDGSQKTLNDINWNFINNAYLDDQNNYVEGTPLTSLEENNNVLFEYNKDFIKHAWRYRNVSIDNQHIFDQIPENDIYKFICPIPCYNGYYDSFDSNKVVINVQGLDRSEYVWGEGFDVQGNVLHTEYINVDGKDNNNYYIYGNSTLLLAELDRNVSEYEINDLRSHYQPYALRLQGLFDNICDPKNNGGFIVNTDNIKDEEKEYIKNGYILQDRFNWDDINTSAVNTTKDIVLGKRTLSALEGSDKTYSDVYDLTNYVNPNATIYVFPELQPTFATNKVLKTRAAIQGGARNLIIAGNRIKHQLRGAFGNSVQYFYVNVLDENNNLIKTSDIYIYGDFAYNLDDPEAATNSGMLTTSTNRNFLAGTGMYTEAATFSQAIASILRTQGKKVARNSIDLQKWPQIPEDLIGNEGEPNVTRINSSQENTGYQFNTVAGANSSLDSYVGERFKIDISLPKSKCKLQVVSSALNVNNYVQPLHGNEWLANTYEFSPEVQQIHNDFRIFNLGYYTDPPLPETFTMIYEGTQVLRDSKVYFNAHIDIASKIYDGSAEVTDDRHTVNKFGLFMNTKSPYEYLISIAKLFNWKFEADPRADQINIYSFSKYYMNEVKNIDNLVDKADYNIDPTVADTNNYNFNLESIETYPADLWKKVNKATYGKTTYTTDYQFQTEPHNILEDVIFKNAVPYQQRSVYFNKQATDGKNYNIPALGKKIKLTLWKFQDPDKTKTQELTVNGALSTGLISQNVLSNNVLLGFFDKEYKHIDSTDTIVFYDKASTAAQYNDTARSSAVQVSDNFPSLTELNNNNCYYWSLRPSDTILIDADNQIAGIPAYLENRPPVFRSYFTNGNTAYFGTMKAEPNEPMVDQESYTDYIDLYQLCWKSYIADLYNKNNKIVTIKVKLLEDPIQAMKKFYTFDNAIWVINKIIDYNIDDYFTKCEFIQVQNINNYVSEEENQ